MRQLHTQIFPATAAAQGGSRGQHRQGEGGAGVHVVGARRYISKMYISNVHLVRYLDVLHVVCFYTDPGPDLKDIIYIFKRPITFGEFEPDFFRPPQLMHNIWLDAPSGHPRLMARFGPNAIQGHL